MRLILKKLAVVFVFLASVLQAQEVISLYKGSSLVYDDDIGYAKMYYLQSSDTMKELEGNVNRRFVQAPKNTTPLEIIKNYESAIKNKAGEVVHISDNAYSFVDGQTQENVAFMRDYFSHKRVTRYSDFAYLQLTRHAQDYIVGKLQSPTHDIYISVAAASLDGDTFYTVVTTHVEAMAMDNVTLNILNEGLAAQGKVAIYDIYFDTAQATLKEDSATALKVIAQFLNQNSEKKFFIVGHTDNVGSFEANLKLSQQRADAVVAALTQNYGVAKSQLRAHGVSFVSPKTSNATPEGKQRNRRVELVVY